MNLEDDNQPRSAPTSEANPLPTPASTPPPFNPSRMIGVIKRKALTKELAAVYHTECLAYCRELLELQTKWKESLIDIKSPVRPPKRVKKGR